jgi:hypothetical protein
LRWEASRTYVLEYSADRVRRRRAERTALGEQLHALTVLPPDLKAQRDALERQASTGYTATDAARKAGDLAGAKAREAEAHSLSRQAREVQQRHDDAMKGQAAEIRARQQAIDSMGRSRGPDRDQCGQAAGRQSRVPSAAYGVRQPRQERGAEGPETWRGALAAPTPRCARRWPPGSIAPGSKAGSAVPLPAAAQSSAAAAAPVAVAAQPGGGHGRACHANHGSGNPHPRPCAGAGRDKRRRRGQAGGRSRQPVRGLFAAERRVRHSRPLPSITAGAMS